MPIKKPKHTTGGFPEGHDFIHKKLVALGEKYGHGPDHTWNLLSGLRSAMAGYSVSVKIHDQAPTPKEVRTQIQRVLAKVEALRACLEELHTETERAIRREGMGGGLELGLKGPLDQLQNCAWVAERKLDDEIAKQKNRGGGKHREYALDIHLRLLADVWKAHKPEWFEGERFRHGKKRVFLVAMQETLMAARQPPPDLKNLDKRLTRIKWFNDSPKNG